MVSLFLADACTTSDKPSYFSRYLLARCVDQWPVKPVIRRTDPSQARTAVEANGVVRRGTHVLEVQAFLRLGCNKSNAPIGHDVPLLRGGVGGTGHEIDP